MPPRVGLEQRGHGACSAAICSSFAPITARSRDTRSPRSPATPGSSDTSRKHAQPALKVQPPPPDGVSRSDPVNGHLRLALDAFRGSAHVALPECEVMLILTNSSSVAARVSGVSLITRCRPPAAPRGPFSILTICEKAALINAAVIGPATGSGGRWWPSPTGSAALTCQLQCAERDEAMPRGVHRVPVAPRRTARGQWR